MTDSPWRTKKEAATYLRCCEDMVDQYRRDDILQPPIGKVGASKVLFHITWLTACEKTLRQRRVRPLAAGDARKEKTGVLNS